MEVNAMLGSEATGPQSAQSDLVYVPVSQSFWAEQLSRVELLSAREAQVFGQLAEGSSNREIAKRLGITERTVKTHVAQIMIKVGVESRLQAGLISLIHRLLNKSLIDDAAAPAEC
jgi:DNA-binding NarL/FixJ family response regulator